MLEILIPLDEEREKEMKMKEKKVTVQSISSVSLL